MTASWCSQSELVLLKLGQERFRIRWLNPNRTDIGG